MPASAGRVRMPHNNRMSTSGSLQSTAIWQKTIGHDPYAGQGDPAAADHAADEAGQRKAQEVLAMARQQNLTDGAARDDFAQRLYRGLKQPKPRRAGDAERADADATEARRQEALLAQEDSSSEDEFVPAGQSQLEKVPAKTTRSRSRRRSKSPDSGGSSSEDSVRRRDRKRHRKDKRRKRKKHERKRRRVDADQSSSGSETDESDRDRKRKKHRRKDRKERRKDESRSRKRSERNRDDESDPRTLKESFVAASKYAGSRKGCVFRSGDKGVGYYVDDKPRVDAKLRDEMLKLYQD